MLFSIKWNEQAYKGWKPKYDFTDKYIWSELTVFGTD